MAVSSSTVRNELAELERRGLLTHPHTSAGRVPTEAGYRLYVDGCSSAPSRARAFGLDLPPARRRGRGGAPGDDRDALAGDAAARARLGAALETATVRHVEVLLLQPNVVMVVVITSTGGVNKLRYAFPSRSTRGSSRGQATISTSSSSAPARLARRPPRFDDAGLSPRERRSSSRSARVRRHAEEDRRLYVGGAAGLLDEMRAEEIGAYRSLMEALEKRAALLDVLAQRARPAAVVRPRRRRARAAACAISRWSARPTGSRTRRSARSASSARCGWTTRRRSAPSGRPRTSCRALSKRSTPRTDGDADRDYYEVLGVARDADEATIKKSFRRLARQLHPDVSDDPDAEVRFREVTRGVRGALERRDPCPLRPLRAQRSASGGFTPTHFDLGDLGDLFSAFFGDDLFGGGARRRARGGRRRRGRDRPRRCRARRHGRRPVRGGRAVRTCGGDGVEPGTTPTTCAVRRRGPAPAGVAQRLRRVRPHAGVPAVRAAAGVIVEHPCKTCDGAGRTLEGRELEVDIPAGIHNGQRIRVSGEGHAGALGGRAGDVYVLVHVEADPRFVREGNDIFSQVDLTIVQAALGLTVTVETLDGPVEVELPGGHPAGRRARPARQGDAGPAGLRPR